MATKTVRLHERPDGLVHTLERTDAELVRAAGVGGSVVDVTLDLPIRGKTAAAALEVLRVSRAEADQATDPKGWGRAEEARRRVAPIALPALPRPDHVAAARQKVAQAEAALDAARAEIQAAAAAEVTGG